MVEQTHQDSKNKTEDVVGGEGEKDKPDDNHIIKGSAEAAFLGPSRMMMMIGHGARSELKTQDRAGRKLAHCNGRGVPVVERWSKGGISRPHDRVCFALERGH